MSDLADGLFALMRLVGLPDPVLEYRFFPPRRWKFDAAYPQLKIAIEVEGGTWIQGRHTTGSGFEGDCEKYNQAAILGWQVLRFTRKMIESGEAIEQIDTALNLREAEQ